MAQILASYDYTPGQVERGYNMRTLYIDLGTLSIREKTVDQDMKEKFVGGKGFNLWLLWQALPQDRVTRWDDPENEILISCGPLGGTIQYPGSGKSIVMTISPLTGSVVDANVGGYFGPYLKFSGFDSIEIQGKARQNVVIVVDGDTHQVRIETAVGVPDDTHMLGPYLGEKYADGNLRSVSTVSAGSGAEHSLMGCLNFSWYDNKRKSYHFKQAGRGGSGTVFRDKRIRSLVVKYSGIKADSNKPADFEALKKGGREFSGEIRTLDPVQNEMAKVGTTHLVPIMNEYDLLPVNNFRYGSHPEAGKIGKEVYRAKFDSGFDGCWMGCTVACSHMIKNFELKSGPYKGQVVWVDGPEYETIAGCGSNWGVFDPDFVAEVNFYCDTYGLDTISVATSVAFAMECVESGLIDETHTGGLPLRFGDQEAALTLLHQIARGEGFGSVVGKGVRQMKAVFATQYGADSRWLQDIGMEVKGLEFSEYITKESLAQQGGYGLALKGAQHDEAWLIFLDMVHGYLPTFEKKAEALHWFPMWRTWFSLNGLCKLPWNDIIPEDNKDTPEPAKVMKHVQWYAEYYNAVTGNTCTPEDLILISERVYNFQRIFNLRQGFGTRAQDTLPYRAMGPVTADEYESRQDRYDSQLQELGIMDPNGKNTAEKMAALRKFREDQYDKLTDAVYQRRGWTTEGVPRLDKIKGLGIDFPEVVALISRYQ